MKHSGPLRKKSHGRLNPAPGILTEMAYTALLAGLCLLISFLAFRG